LRLPVGFNRFIPIRAEKLFVSDDEFLYPPAGGGARLSLFREGRFKNLSVSAGETMVMS
jgi:hypothetical protein